MHKKLVKTSKFLSFVLRHRPQKIGLTLDAQGWVLVADLIERAESAGYHLTRELLEEVITRNDKQRFSLSEDGRYIRANQGHSISVDLGLRPVAPPEHLYHGTATRNLDSILCKGLLKGQRHDVHLYADATTACNVGQRHGKPVVLTVNAGAMHRDGFQFFLAKNGVWLTESVPPQYLEIAGCPSKAT